MMDLGAVPIPIVGPQVASHFTAPLHNRASIQGIVAAGFHLVVKVIYAWLCDLSRLWMIGYPAAAAPLVTQARTAAGRSCRRRQGWDGKRRGR
jgi:hypothetical protein